MYRPFRQFHILNILESYERQTLPLDYFLSLYFRTHKALGSKDRGAIVETIYAIIRWKGLLDYLCEAPLTWEKRLDLFLNHAIDHSLQRQDIPPHIRLSFPKDLFNQIVESHGHEKASTLCAVSNTPAPVTIRINPLKTTRAEMLLKWKELYEIFPCRFSSNGIIFKKRVNFFEMPEFKQGLFEVQDEGSQLLADLVSVSPGDQVMDYCAGAGGKALAFASNMQNKGQIFLHDIRRHALLDSRKRLRRAGIQNAQIIYADDEAKLKRLKKTMDWVLVDSPCTGTGTMRRNPDMKWKFDMEMLKRLVGQQRVIFEKALSFMKSNGRIVYATCSLLQQENQKQLDHFINTYELELIDSFESLPEKGGMDGFFGAVLKKKDRSSI